MRTLLVAAALAVCCLQAFAAANPDCQVCVDFSGTASSWADVQSRIDPELYDVVDAYLCIYGINEFVGICLAVGVSSEIQCAALGYTSLLPDSHVWGPWEEGTYLCSPVCLYDRFLYFARVSFVYLGGSGDIMILDHQEYPRWVLDCSSPAEVDYYCVWMHGGVGKPALEGDEDCYPVVPVEDASWGAVKSLYR